MSTEECVENTDATTTSTLNRGDEGSDPIPDEVHVQTRLDISASMMTGWTEEQKQAFVDSVHTKAYPTVTTVHLSGRDLQAELTEEQIVALVSAIGKMYNVTELFCFQGDAAALTADLLAASLPPNLTVLMLWHLRTMPESLASAMRQHRNLTRVTLNFPCPRNAKYQLEWGCLDVYAMAFCSMEQLEVLQIRCVTSTDYHQVVERTVNITQEDSIITPEALTLLLNSTAIQHLYLENCGLMDDHMDVVAAELPANRSLISLDLQNNNLFTEDVWYTTGLLLPKLSPQMTSINISCSASPSMSREAGRAMANGMQQNKTLLTLEVEGTLSHFHNEFCIPDGHRNEEWMTDITHQLRLNRAYAAAYAEARPSSHWNAGGNSAVAGIRPRNPVAPAKPSPKSLIKANAAHFVVAVSAVSDHVEGIYHFLRTYPSHCDRLRAPSVHVEPRGETPYVKN